MFMDFLLGGMAGCGAVTFTNPLEVVKTRMQLLGELGLTKEGQYKSIYDAFSKIAKQEGLPGLQRGLIPAYLTQMAMNGIRLGSYDNIKEFIHSIRFSDNDNHGAAGGASYSFLRNVVSGALAGSLAATVANPLEMTKTRFQAQGKSVEIVHKYNYTNVFSALGSIVKTDGILGLWRGCSATALRTGVGSAVQLSTFDQAKIFIIDIGFGQKDSTTLHILASFVSGLLVTLAMNPLDVVRTRVWNQNVQEHKGALYKGPIDCLIKTVKAEGFVSLYKGFLPHYLRLAPHTTLTLVIWTELKKLTHREREF